MLRRVLFVCGKSIFGMRMVNLKWNSKSQFRKAAWECWVTDTMVVDGVGDGHDTLLEKNVPHLEMKAISFPPNWINQDSFLSFKQVFFHFGHWIGKDLTWKWFKMYGKIENFTSDNALRRRHLLRALNQKKWHSKITSQKLDSHSPRRTLCRFFLFDILPNNGWRA